LTSPICYFFGHDKEIVDTEESLLAEEVPVSECQRWGCGYRQREYAAVIATEILTGALVAYVSEMLDEPDDEDQEGGDTESS
jgi:hypothetical protein